MKPGTLEETLKGKTRIAPTSETVNKLKAPDHPLPVERGTGLAAADADQRLF